MKKPEQNTNWVLNQYNHLRSARARNHVLNLIKADQKCVRSPDEFDRDPLIIGSPEDTINLESGLTSTPKPEDMLTKHTVCSPNPNKEPYLWLKFLNETFARDQETIKFLQTLCGYILTGLTREHKLFFLYGTGANGKSIFLETLFYILGDYAKRAPATLFLEQRNSEHPTAMAGLEGARLVVGSELPSGKTWNDQVIKDLTGGDTITARRMRQDFTEYKPQFTILIAGNHQPRLRNVDKSVTRRMVMIPFSVTVPPEKLDVNLADKLKAESGSILQWCIDGAVQYFQHGLAIPESIKAASREYIRNEDVIGEYIEMQLVAGERCEVSAVYARYREWLSAQGYNYTMTERQFRKELKDRNMTITRVQGKYVLWDYALCFDPQ